MAKALVGHLGGYDSRTELEMRRLREQVRLLEAEVVRLRTENAALNGVLSIEVKEPVPA